MIETELKETPHGTQPIPESQEYRLSRMTLSSADESALSEWRAYAGRDSSDPMQDPEWLRGFFDGELQNLTACFLYDSNSLRGIVPFLLRPWPMRLYLGEFPIGKLPLRRLRLVGTTLDIPETESAYDVLFKELAELRSGFDVIFFEEVPVDAFLWKYLQTSSAIRKSFRKYIPSPPFPHYTLRFNGTFDGYMKKFSSRHRHNLRRRISKFYEEAPAEVKWVKYTKPEEVNVFLELAVAVSRKSYQWNLFQRGLYAAELLRRRLQFAAANGWFRSYILFCGMAPVSFVVGFQHHGQFDHYEVGYDPEWKKYAVGTVLQLLMIEDLFNNNTPEVLDFGLDADYKEEFSNDSSLRQNVFLFKRGPYTRFVQTSHQACELTTKTVSGLLEILNLKSKLKKALRWWRASQKK